MASDIRPGSGPDLEFLLRDLLSRVPRTRSAVLLSSDGLPKAAAGMDRTEADQLSAAASGLLSMARTVAVHFGGTDEVQQLIGELGEIYLFVSAAGEGSVLAVIADRQAEAGVVGYEMGQLVRSLSKKLATPVRAPGGS